MPAPIVTVELDRPRQISWSQRAQYRLGTLPVCPRAFDFSEPQRSYATLVAYLWAMLSPADSKDFAAPEDLAEHVTAERLPALMTGLTDAINGATKTTEKNGNGSTRKPSRASS